VLIDIDLDYFFIENLTEANADDKIGERKQWLSSRIFNKYFVEKKFKPTLITISYSVNDGWVPMKFKHLANKLANKLGYETLENKKRILAGEYFKKFRELFEKNKLQEAKPFYFLSLKLNPSYFSFDNNYGKLFITHGSLNKAIEEFSKMSIIDKNYYYSNIGIGMCFLIKKDFKKALFYFKKAKLQVPTNSISRVFIEITKFLFRNNQYKIKSIPSDLLKNDLIKLIVNYVNSSSKNKQKVINNNLMEKILNLE
jgi:tetratricopeptide (TPR) repeat protein